LSEGSRKLRAGDETGAEGEGEEEASEEKRFSGRTMERRSVTDAVGRGGGPIDVAREGWRRIFWKRWGHGIICA